MAVFDGKALAMLIKSQVAEEVKKLNKKLKLAVILVGQNPASELYVRNKEKACSDVGIDFELIRFAEICKQADVVKKIKELNRKPEVSAILVQLPLPKHLNEREIIDTISPDKDVDCLTQANFGKLALGLSDFAPCTAAGVLEILKASQIAIQGKRVAVVGRSALVGLPTAHLLTKNNATVALCHSKTQKLKKITKKADILVVAIGKPRFITKKYVKKHAVVIDVGINKVDGKICGDVDFEKVKKKAHLITPVPGGVGQITVSMLLKNILLLNLEKK